MEDNLEELVRLVREADKIVKEELQRVGLDPTMAEVRILDCKTVGVQGDQRTYSYPVEITVYDNGKLRLIDYDVLETIANRIPNEVKGINRITYTIARRD